MVKYTPKSPELRRENLVFVFSLPWTGSHGSVSPNKRNKTLRKVLQRSFKKHKSVETSKGCWDVVAHVSPVFRQGWDTCLMGLGRPEHALAPGRVQIHRTLEALNLKHAHMLASWEAELQDEESMCSLNMKRLCHSNKMHMFKKLYHARTISRMRNPFPVEAVIGYNIFLPSNHSHTLRIGSKPSHNSNFTSSLE